MKGSIALWMSHRCWRGGRALPEVRTVSKPVLYLYTCLSSSSPSTQQRSLSELKLSGYPVVKPDTKGCRA